MSSRKKNTTSSINRIGLAADQSLLGFNDNGSTVYQSATLMQGIESSLMLAKFDSNYGSKNQISFPIDNHPIDSF